MRISITSLMLLVCLHGQASAHPASGIVVDAEGQVFFLDTGEPRRFSGFIWKIDRQGRLTAIHDSGGHFLTLDAKNRFAGSDLMGWFRSKRTQWLLRTPVPGSTSALIQADGSPIAMGPDGGLYYVSGEQLERAGVEQIARLASDGALRTPTPSLPPVSKRLGGIRGLAAGHDGSLYVSYESAVQKVTTAGSVTTLAENMSLTECDAVADRRCRLRRRCVRARVHESRRFVEGMAAARSKDSARWHRDDGGDRLSGRQGSRSVALTRRRGSFLATHAAYRGERAPESLRTRNTESPNSWPKYPCASATLFIRASASSS